MPVHLYELKGHASQTISISQKRVGAEIVVRLNHRLLGKLTTPEEMSAGRRFLLEDGATITVQVVDEQVLVTTTPGQADLSSRQQEILRQAGLYLLGVGLGLVDLLAFGLLKKVHLPPLDVAIYEFCISIGLLLAGIGCLMSKKVRFLGFGVLTVLPVLIFIGY